MAQYDDIDILAALEGGEKTTSEVADSMEMSDRWARERLNRLVDSGLVEREGKGFASWNLTEKGKDKLE